jgi:hypothetical protein
MRKHQSSKATSPIELPDIQVGVENKPRGLGPRSRLVEAIAVLLLARPMRAAEIAEVLGYSTRYISSYLSYWKIRGLFEYENGYWTLTAEGEEYARTIVEKEMNTRVAQYAALAKKIISDNHRAKPIQQTIKGKNETREYTLSGRLQSFIAAQTNKRRKKRQDRPPIKACINALLSTLELEEDEQSVLEALLDHYAKWGSTYTYLDHLEKELEADRTWLISVARILQAKKLIYIYTDRRLGIRIGFSKKLRDYLESCSREEPFEPEE